MFDDDWGAIVRIRPNVLLQGPKSVTDACLQQLLAHCHGSTLLEDVDTYGLEEQAALLDWLDYSGRVQVISTTRKPLFDCVQRGHFIRRLYYRLNTILLDLYLPVTAQGQGAANGFDSTETHP